jgi:hypothetical protein
MGKKFVRVLADVHCDWEGLPPIYRVFVNDELFAERTWNLNPDQFIEELLQLEAEPGNYHMRYELVQPNLAYLTVENIRAEHGPVTIKGTKIRIHDESA